MDKDVVHMRTHMEYYSAIKKEWNAICSIMDGPTEGSKSDKDKYMISLNCGI